MHRVGILGGMGPEATILIMQKVLAAVDAADDADHIPLIVDQNPQVPSRIQRLIEGTGTDPGPVLADMARRLVAGGAEALAMPCNTAHHYAPAIRAAVYVPFLDMVQLSVAYAATFCETNQTVGILASPAVRQVGLFDTALTKHGLSGLYASDEAAMLTGIRQIKAEGPCPTARQTLKAASNDLLRRGAGVQLVACTEFSLIADSIASTTEPTGALQVIDTLDVLVGAIRDFALDGNKVQGAPDTRP